ncbi:hypothetical protein DFJ73DRAFT_809715 [Zopfochytrium polystomum]|nr:hypothetical protein DFJ73DRAFT_809715 [Zopfochytrium polystomum]
MGCLSNCSASTDLREQLGTAIANLQDAEKIHSRTLANLRKTNASLQDQLHSALQDVRNTEQAHNRTISALEADLESLRSELSNASIAQFELENEKKRLAREKVDAIRESQSVESADTRVIYDLQKRIRALEDANAAALASKKDAERKLKQAREDLEEAKSLAAELQERVESAVGLREECERRGALIMELKEQLEDSRTSAIDSNEAKMFQNATTVVKRPTGPANSELSVVLQKGDQEWSWSPWLMSVREKVWERDINGLRDEIADLTQHREAAYVRLRSGIDEMLGIFVQALPTPVQAITTRVIGVLSPPMAAAGLPAATIAASPETKKLIAAAAEPTDAAAPAPEEKDVPSNAVSEAATPGPVA